LRTLCPTELIPEARFFARPGEMEASYVFRMCDDPN
jgi:hypothetical protein